MNNARCHSAAYRIGLLLAFSSPGLAQTFTQTCANPHYPSPPPAHLRSIDSTCSVSGSGGLEAAQNTAKNNFCATGTPSPIAIADMVALQQQVVANTSIPFGDQASKTRPAGPATNRAPLQKLGEGQIRVLTGYVLIARQEGAESVNCGTNVPNDSLDHDIHINVGAQPGSAECTGVVAEMVPHHRPDSWNPVNVNKIAKAKAFVRITGQLFFDSSHVPCASGKPVRDNPSRATLWEIHPIYAFDVCTAGCTSTSPTWVPFDQWVKTH